MEEDSFQFKRAYLKWIKSNNNKFLTLTECNEFKAQNLSTDEQPGEAQQLTFTEFRAVYHLSLNKV